MSAEACTAAPRLSPLTVTEHRDSADFDRLRETWNRLVNSSASLSLFATPEWLLSWWHAYGTKRELLVLTFANAVGHTVGICPLYFDQPRSPLFRGMKVLRLVGDGSADSDDLDFIVLPGYEREVAQAFMAWAETQPWGWCEFNSISPRSLTINFVLEELKARRWKHLVGSRPFFTIKLPNSWEQYLKQLSSKERAKVGIRLRRLQSRYEVRFRRCESVEQLPAFLEPLFSLHQKRWVSKGEPGSFSLPERRKFYYEMTRELFLRSRLELWLMELDGIPVAAQISLRYRDTLCSLQEGFDPDYGNDSVGYVLRSHILHQNIAAGIRTYDFLYGDQDSKKRWAADAGEYLDIRFARPGSLGVTCLVTMNTVKGLKNRLRRQVSTDTWRRLQIIKKTLMTKVAA